jgi:hypothetical protein
MYPNGHTRDIATEHSFLAQVSYDNSLWAVQDYDNDFEGPALISREEF